MHMTKGPRCTAHRHRASKRARSDLRRHVAVEAELGEASPQSWSRWKVHVLVDLLELGYLASCSANTSIDALKPASIISLGKGFSCVCAATRRLSATGLRASYLASCHARAPRGGIDDGLVLRRQRVVGLLVDEELQLRRRLPPARVVVERRDLVKPSFSSS